ncbi:MAG: chromosomal replication initiator protein DnaA [Sphingomonadaceae bacterium]|nr:chromosomal replication initiator protein DnaA [Sphingomonadaceae bacterium]
MPERMSTGDLDAFDEAWEGIRNGLRRDLGARTFDHWLKPMRLAGFDAEPGLVRLELPSHFMTDWVNEHYSERLRFAWRAAMPAAHEIEIAAAASATRPALFVVGDEEAIAAEAVPGDGERSIGTPLEIRYTFGNFVTGAANEVAFNAARLIANASDTAAMFSALFIHAGTGLGKTHLLHAVGHEFLRQRPRARVLYMSAEKFMYEFISAMKEHDTIGFKQRLRSADLLLVDDVQFIVGKDATQEEFFHTINEIVGSGHRLVISADRPPHELGVADKRLASRLAGGLVTDLRAPDYAHRRRIVAHRLAEMPQAEMPEEVATFLAQRFAGSVRELEGALTRVVAYSLLSRRPIDLAFTHETLSDLLRHSQRKITIDEIQRSVCEHYGIRQTEMTSARRAREVARPRQVAMYLAKRLTPRSLPEIGRRFGGRDHTTVIHAIRRIEQLRREDSDIDSDVRTLLRKLED